MNELQNKLTVEKGEFLLLQTVIDLLPNPMSIKNSRLERVFINQAFVDLLGYSQEALLGESQLDIRSSEGKASGSCDKRVLATRKPTQHTEKILNAKGQNRWVEIQKSYFQTQTGESHIISVLTDITDLKHRELELIDEKAKIYQRGVQKARFLANMGHDIRQPLQGIVGMTDFLSGSELDHAQIDAVKVMGRASDALMRIIDDIIDFAKIDAGTLKIQNHQFHLRDFIEELTDILGMSARDKHIDLIVSIDDNLQETFVGDTVRIRQILMNLIENALKFTSEGFVSINVRGVHRNGTTNLEFIVKDTGIGIPQDKLTKLFRFVESNEDTERIKGVSGLGVSLCQKLAKLMNGTLEADSVNGIGSEFKLILPLEFKPSLKAIQGITALSNSHEDAMHRVLIVDDIKENYDALLPYLSKYGLSADYAQSASHAVQLLNNAALDGTPYSLIFIDYLMPVTHGLLLTASLRSSKNYSNSKIVALSSVNDAEIRESFISQNVMHYLTKPVHKAAVETILEEHNFDDFTHSSLSQALI